MTTTPPDPRVTTGGDRHDAAALDLAAVTARPVQGECVVCFVARARRAGQCQGWELLEAYRRARAPAALGLPDRWTRVGVDCACGLVDGAYVLAREHLERDLHTDELRAPDPLPGCHAVAPGSARPCGLWVRGRRRRPGETFGGLPQAEDSQARST